MKTKNLFPFLGEALMRSWARRGVASVRSRILFALIAVLNLLSVGQTPGQTFTTLHSFTGVGSPFGGLVLSSNTLYGTTYGIDDAGGGYGTVFAISTHGTGFRTLPGNSIAGLIVSGNTLYGTMAGAAQPSADPGAVFAVNTDGTGFTYLHSFTSVPDYEPYVNLDGAEPRAGVILSEATLYGTAYFGGSSGIGTIFKLSTNGTGFTVLHSFTGSSDGVVPQAGLILSGNNLYGTAGSGGSSGNGTVFAVNTNGTGFTNLHAFTASTDGANPRAGLILLGNTLYGTAQNGGSSTFGTVFAINTNGTGFTNLHTFT